MPLYPTAKTDGTISAQQAASGLMQALFLALEHSADDKLKETIPHAFLHFHDDSTTQIAFNDVQAIVMYNATFNANLPVPLTASEGYQQHYHSSPYDGGFMPVRPHDHRDNNLGNGGFAFAVYAPGTGLPQQAWSI